MYREEVKKMTGSLMLSRVAKHVTGFGAMSSSAASADGVADSMGNVWSVTDSGNVTVTPGTIGPSPARPPTPVGWCIFLPMTATDDSYEKAESLRSGQLRLRRSPNQRTSELTALVGTPRARHEMRGKI